MIIIDLVTPKEGAKNKLLFNKRASEACRGFFEHPSPTQVAQQSVTHIKSLTIMNFVTPTAGAEDELLFNKLPSVF